jgi:TolA-binding protein
MSRSSFPPLEDDFTRALLRSAEADEPSHAAYTKAATALGVGAGVGLGASLAAPSALAAGAAGAARWSGATAVRLAALGVSGALLIGGGALLLHARLSGGAAARAAHESVASVSSGSSGSSVSSVSSVSSGAPLRPDVSNAAQSAAKAAALLAEPPGAASEALATPQSPSAAQALAASHAVSSHGGGAAMRRPVHGFSGSAQGASSGSSLAEQVQSLDRARVALGSGDASTALREIARYRRSWPRGVFLTEASVLEIEGLAARGERSLAAQRAAAFVAAHPDSPQASRLRAFIPAEKP